MFVIKIADIKIAIKNKFDFIVRQCEEYLIESNDVDFSVEVSNEEFLAEKNASGEKFSDGFIESVCIYRNIAKQQLIPSRLSHMFDNTKFSKSCII